MSIVGPENADFCRAFAGDNLRPEEGFRVCSDSTLYVRDGVKARKADISFGIAFADIEFIVGNNEFPNDNGRMCGGEYLLACHFQPEKKSTYAVRFKASFDFVDQGYILAVMELHLHGGSDEFFRAAAFVAKRHIVFMQGQCSGGYGPALEVNLGRQLVEIDTGIAGFGPDYVGDALTLGDTFMFGNVGLA